MIPVTCDRLEGREGREQTNDQYLPPGIYPIARNNSSNNNNNRDGVTGEWRKLHNEELNDLYSSPNIVRVIKSRRLRWAGHVARMKEGRGVHKVLVG